VEQASNITANQALRFKILLKINTLDERYMRRRTGKSKKKSLTVLEVEHHGRMKSPYQARRKSLLAQLAALPMI